MRWTHVVSFSCVVHWQRPSEVCCPTCFPPIPKTLGIHCAFFGPPPFFSCCLLFWNAFDHFLISQNGITIAKKAKSSLIKVWMTDSLNQPVITAMSEWFDENVDHLCGRRLFSPHKYILKTFSRVCLRRLFLDVCQMPNVMLFRHTDQGFF